jgi:hypothetical protein
MKRIIHITLQDKLIKGLHKVNHLKAVWVFHLGLEMLRVFTDIPFFSCPREDSIPTFPIIVARTHVLKYHESLNGWLLEQRQAEKVATCVSGWKYLIDCGFLSDSLRAIS